MESRTAMLQKSLSFCCGLSLIVLILILWVGEISKKWRNFRVRFDVEPALRRHLAR
jgi:hypothetical protein